jgi:hypothetical protein
MLRKVISIYSIVMGISMISMWTMFYFTGGIPELSTEPASIIMHMIAEYATAIGLITAGYGLLAFKRWGYDIYLLSTGALIYTLIQSPGYYLQQGVLGFVIMFTVFMIITVVLLVKMLRKIEACSNKNYLNR